MLPIWTVPENATFYQQFIPSRGDLVYGLHDARLSYIGPSTVSEWLWHIAWMGPLSSEQLAHASDPKNVFIDGYNRYAGFPASSSAFFPADSKGTQVGTLKHYIDEQMRDHIPASPSTSTPNEQRIAEQRTAYRNLLIGDRPSRFSPVKMYDMPKAWRQQVAGEPTDYGYTVRLMQGMEDKSLRRLCKMGVAMVASDPAFVQRGAKVHFVLDGMGDLGDVAEKLPVQTEIDDLDGTVPFTTQELCYVFRYWNYFCDTLLFYVNTRQVRPPWEEDWVKDSKNNMGTVYAKQRSWHRYGVRRANKPPKHPLY